MRMKVYFKVKFECKRSIGRLQAEVGIKYSVRENL